MTTTENNKLIAQFMGFNFNRFENDGIIEPQEEMFFTDNKTFTLDELRFDKDWNWLMEVVEKIESLGYSFVIEDESSVVYSKDIRTVEDQIGAYSERKINSVYSVCVMFIKTHNKL